MGDTLEDHIDPVDAFTVTLERDPLLRATIVAVATFDRAPDWDVLVDRIDRATRLVPRFRQKLVTVPWGLAPPRWIVDPDFDLSLHLHTGAGASRRGHAGGAAARPLGRAHLVRPRPTVVGVHPGRGAPVEAGGADHEAPPRAHRRRRRDRDRRARGRPRTGACRARADAARAGRQGPRRGRSGDRHDRLPPAPGRGCRRRDAPGDPPHAAPRHRPPRRDGDRRGEHRARDRTLRAPRDRHELAGDDRAPTAARLLLVRRGLRRPVRSGAPDGLRRSTTPSSPASPAACGATTNATWRWSTTSG